MCYGFAGEHTDNVYQMAAVARAKKMTDDQIRHALEWNGLEKQRTEYLIRQVLGLVNAAKKRVAA